MKGLSSENSFDAERRLALGDYENIDHPMAGENSFDAERRLAQFQVVGKIANFVVKIPSMPKGV